MTSIVLSVVGLGCLAPGALGALLGAIELRAIRRGDAPPAGESFVYVAIALGLIEMIALVSSAVLALTSAW